MFQAAGLDPVQGAAAVGGETGGKARPGLQAGDSSTDEPHACAAGSASGATTLANRANATQSFRVERGFCMGVLETSVQGGMGLQR